MINAVNDFWFFTKKITAPIHPITTPTRQKQMEEGLCK